MADKIKKFYCNGQDGEGWYVVRHPDAKYGEVKACSSQRGADELVDSLNKIVTGVIEECIKFVEGGVFLTNDSPAARMAKECAKEMRKQLL